MHGAHHLDEVSDKPLVIFANHLSYSDANVVEVILRNLAREARAVWPIA